MKTKKLKTPALIAGIAVTVLLAQPTTVTLVAGCCLVALGEAIRIWAAGHLKRMQELATSGPYAHLRDPLYLGRFFLIVGFCIMGWGYCLLVLPVALGVFFLNYIPRKHQKEMSRLETMFGDEYRQYSAYARSLVPRLKPYPGARKRAWSFALLWNENREQYFLLIILTVFAAMLLRYTGVL